MDDYTGADNDTFMTEMIEDYGTKGLKTPANPDGVQLTKWNGERATRKFVETALKIDGAVLDGWMAKYPSFRSFVIDSYQDRFDELMHTIDSIAFMNMDERLMKYLLDKKQSQGSFVIEKTHEQIAQELNTSRVVVSRLLKKLEKEDKVELYRNRIEVL